MNRLFEAVDNAFENNSDINKEYRYITNHGVGPGMCPDNTFIRSEDLDNGKTAIYLKRPLSDEELKKYDIKPEWIQESEEGTDKMEQHIFDTYREDGEMPDYEYFTNYIMDVSEDEFENAKNKVQNVVDNIATYADHENGHTEYIQLSDNATISDLTNTDKDINDWADIVNRKCEEFEAETGVELYLLGRSGRHACVELNYENAKNINELFKVQQRLEKEAIEEFNGVEDSMNESDIFSGYEKALPSANDGRYYLGYNLSDLVDAVNKFYGCHNRREAFDKIKNKEFTDEEIKKACEQVGVSFEGSDLHNVDIYESKDSLNENKEEILTPEQIDKLNSIKDQLRNLQSVIEHTVSDTIISINSQIEEVNKDIYNKILEIDTNNLYSNISDVLDDIDSALTFSNYAVEDENE